MKSSTRLLVLALILFPCSNFGQTKTGEFANKIKPHPRILLLAGEEDRIKHKLSIDATYNFLHKIIIRECESLLTTPPVVREMTGRRLLSVSRESRRRIFFLAYAYRVSGEEKYFARAEAELLASANFTDWNPAHFLDVAEMTMGIAIGYDWLYEKLSPQTRRTLEDAILVKGIKPSLLPENSKWLTASHNWNQVCNASMSYGAIALLDKYPDICLRVLERSTNSVVLAMNEYLPDGGYPEGYGYWSYGTTFNVLLISALEKAFDNDFGLSRHAGFVKTPYYLMNMTGSSGLPFNFSDCDTKPLLNPAMAWFAARLNDPALMTCELKLIGGNKNLHRIRELPALMVWGTAFDFNKVPTPGSLLWVSHGKTPVALLRSSWSPDSGIYVGIKGGSASTTHSHLDAGSFVMDALGERWAMDFGVQDYNSLESKGVKLWNLDQNSERWKVFRLSNLSHNTLSFNKGLQDVNGVANITCATDQPAFRSAIVDLSSIYPTDARKVQRGVAIVNDQYVAIRDEIELRMPSDVRWNMLTDAEVTIIDNKTAELRKNGKKVILRVAEPSDAVLTTWSTDPPQPFDAPNPGTVFVGFEVRRKMKDNVSFSVLLIPGEATLENNKAIPILSEWPLISQPK
jgi:hypothetical protein